MTDLTCPVAGRTCRHISRTIHVKEVAHIKTRKAEKIISYGDPFCNDYQEYVSQIPHCIHHPKPRSGQQVLIID